MSGSKNYRILLFSCLLLFALAAACSDETPIEHVENNANNSNNANNTSPGDDVGNNGGEDTSGPPPVPDDSGVAILIDEREYKLTDGFSDAITVQVPPNTISMTITVQGHNSEMYGIGYWTGPNDFSIIPKNWELNNYSQMCVKNCNNRIALSEGTFAALAPNNPSSKVEPGQHVFSVYGLSPQGIAGTPSNREVRVTVHTKVREELPTTGVLDLNLYFTGSNGWTAESAKTDPAFQQIISQVDTIYQSVGVRLGELTYQDIDARYKVIESVTGPESDLMELFAQSSRSRMNAVNLFFVDELTIPPIMGGGGGTILGIAGGIPGPLLTQGTAKSGVAVISKTIPGGPGIASVVAHEAGHFLGLFHTTEHENPMADFMGMPKHDPLPDTPEFDESYLMHAGGSGDKLSPWQGRIIRSNPWVRHTEQAQ